jgi:MarR family transcriptional repressor of emrRAB
MSERVDRTANLLGALALVVTDRIIEQIDDASGQSESAATALAAMHSFLDRPTIDQLRRVLGLTSSGAVRLVDRLEAAGLVARGAGDDARATLLSLTPAGRRAAQRIVAARATVLVDALSVLSRSERQELEDLLSRVIVRFVRGPDERPAVAAWMCRLCDTSACGHDTGECQVTRTARDLYA